MASLIIAAYGEGALYPPNLEANKSDIVSAGWTNLIFGLFHITTSGDIHYNNTPVFVNGSYVGNSDWPAQITGLNESFTSMLASFGGGGGVRDFTNVQNIYDANNHSFDGTNLKKNFTAMYTTLGSVLPVIDMDVEDNYDLDSFVALCQMLIELKYKLTFCPYTEISFWTTSLYRLDKSNSGSVLWWNLQCYDGGAGNDPQQWAASIDVSVPGFDTAGFIVPGDWARSANGGGDTPTQVQSLLSSFSSESAVGGGFIWNIDVILADPSYSGAEYVQAIQNALGSGGKAG